METVLKLQVPKVCSCCCFVFWFLFLFFLFFWICLNMMERGWRDDGERMERGWREDVKDESL